MTIYKDLRLKREERKASWGISWGIYIPSPWVILLSAIWRSPAIPLSPECSTFLRDLPLLFPSGPSILPISSGPSISFLLFGIFLLLSGNILQFPDNWGRIVKLNDRN